MPSMPPNPDPPIEIDKANAEVQRWSAFFDAAKELFEVSGRTSNSTTRAHANRDIHALTSRRLHLRGGGVVADPPADDRVSFDGGRRRQPNERSPPQRAAVLDVEGAAINQRFQG